MTFYNFTPSKKTKAFFGGGIKFLEYFPEFLVLAHEFFWLEQAKTYWLFSATYGHFIRFQNKKCVISGIFANLEVLFW
jgi:hypothetical protein